MPENISNEQFLFNCRFDEIFLCFPNLFISFSFGAYPFERDFDDFGVCSGNFPSFNQS